MDNLSISSCPKVYQQTDTLQKYDDCVMISGLVSSLKCDGDKSEMHVHRHSREGNKQTYIPESCCIKS